jgi:type VI protein secretion system component VasF
VLGDAGETAQQAWSQAGEVAEDVVDAGRRATKSVSRQIGEHPMISVLVGCTLGYIAGWLIHGWTADHEESKTIRPMSKTS